MASCPCKELHSLVNNRATSKNHIVFILAVITGALIWILSPLVTGQQEPWDAEGPYYFAALFIGGALFGAICPVRVYRWALAIYWSTAGLTICWYGATYSYRCIFLGRMFVNCTHRSIINCNTNTRAKEP